MNLISIETTQSALQLIIIDYDHLFVFFMFLQAILFVETL